MDHLVFQIRIPLPDMRNVATVGEHIQVAAVRPDYALHVAESQLPGLIRPVAQLQTGEEMETRSALNHRYLFKHIVGLITRIYLLPVQFTLYARFGTETTPFLFQSSQQQIRTAIKVIFIFFLRVGLPLSGSQFVPVSVIALILETPDVSYPQMPVIGKEFSVEDRQVIIILVLIDIVIILGNDLACFRLLVLVFVIFVIPEIIVIEHDVQTILRIVEGMVPTRLCGIGFLPLVVITVAEHHRLQIPVHQLIVMDLPVAAVIHQVIQTVNRDQVVCRQVISDTQIGEMHIGAGGRIIVHDGCPPFVRRRLAERTLTELPAIIIFSDNMKLARMQIQDRTGIITFLESGSQRQDQRRISGRINSRRQVQNPCISIRHKPDGRSRRHRHPVEEQCRKLDQHIPAILFQQAVGHSVYQ